MTHQITTTQRRNEAPQRHYPASPFRLFEDFFNDWAMRAAERSGEGWRPAVDILEKEGHTILKIDVPGVSEKQIELKVDGNTLTIKGERKLDAETEPATFYLVEGFYGSFSRSFTLPGTADLDKISAGCRDGILTVIIPQKPQAQPKTIKIDS